MGKKFKQLQKCKVNIAEKSYKQKEQKVTHLVENEFDFEVFLTGMMLSEIR